MIVHLYDCYDHERKNPQEGDMFKENGIIKIKTTKGTFEEKVLKSWDWIIEIASGDEIGCYGDCDKCVTPIC